MNPQNDKKLAPIVLFVYNRPEHTRKTVEALASNFLAIESELFVYSDGPKNDESKKKNTEVRKYIKTVTGFKSVNIVERKENMGLANSIIAGVTEIVDRFGKVIVLEDDLVTSPYFLTYVNDALDFYEGEEKVISIHGYVYPVKKELPETFFLKGADCWGWATWKRGWDLFEPNGEKLLIELQKRNLTEEFDFNGTYGYVNMLKRQIEGKNNSWAIRWYASAFLNDKLTLYPGKSLVDNIGQDSSGTHKGNSTAQKVVISQSKILIRDIKIEEDVVARKAFENYFNSLRPGFIIKGIKKLLKFT